MSHSGARDDTVLILSTDSVTAALLSLLAELEGYRAVFAERDEAPSRSIIRLRPRFVLVDCDHSAACTDELFQLARSHSARVVIFSPGRMNEDVRSFAESRSLPWFSLPIDRGTLARTLRGASLAVLPFAMLTLAI